MLRDIQCRTKMDLGTKVGPDGLLNKQDKWAEPLGKETVPQSSHCTAESTPAGPGPSGDTKTAQAREETVGGFLLDLDVGKGLSTMTPIQRRQETDAQDA